MLMTYNLKYYWGGCTMQIRSTACTVTTQMPLQLCEKIKTKSIEELQLFADT